MARYRLMLLDAPPRPGPALEALGRSLPPGVDAAAFAALHARAFVEPVLLGRGDDLAELEAATGRLQAAGLAVCVIDDSTAWIRLVDTLRSTLGIGTVKELTHDGGGPARRFADAPAGGVGVRDGIDPKWRRIALGGGALLLAVALVAGVAAIFGGPSEGTSETRAAAMTSDEAAPGEHARGHHRRRSMRAGGGGGGAGGPETREHHGRDGRSAGTSATGGDEGGVEVELSNTPEAQETPAPEPARRSGRRAATAAGALLIGLLLAALLGEAIEWATRSRSARFRRRLRMAVAGVTGLGVLVVPVVVWQARASARPAAPLAVMATAPTVEDAGAHADERCAGGPFARFVCRSGRAPARAPRDAHPFASMLAGYRQRAPHHVDAGAPVDAPALVAAAPREHSHHGSHHHHHAHDVVSAVDASVDASVGAATAAETPAPVAIVDASAPASAPEAAPNETMAVAAPPVETPVPEAPPPPPTPVVERPRQDRSGQRWAGLWLLAGLAVGTWVAPGWRRLGRST